MHFPRAKHAAWAISAALVLSGSSSGQLPGDADQDGDRDLRDYGRFQECLHADLDSMPECAVFDFEPDEDVDLDDYALFFAGLTGPLQPLTITLWSPATDEVIEELGATVETIEITFSVAIDPGTIKPGSLQVTHQLGGVFAASALELAQEDTVAKFSFQPPLFAPGEYLLELSTGLQSVDGAYLSGDHTSRFRLGGNVIVGTSPAGGEGSVALTRETIVTFNDPIDPEFD